MEWEAPAGGRQSWHGQMWPGCRQRRRRQRSSSGLFQLANGEGAHLLSIEIAIRPQRVSTLPER